MLCRPLHFANHPIGVWGNRDNDIGEGYISCAFTGEHDARLRLIWRTSRDNKHINKTSAVSFFVCCEEDAMRTSSACAKEDAEDIKKRAQRTQITLTLSHKTKRQKPKRQALQPAAG